MLLSYAHVNHALMASMRSLEAVEGRLRGKNLLALLALQVWWTSLNIHLNSLAALLCSCKSGSSGLYEATGGCRGRFRGKNILALLALQVWWTSLKIQLILPDPPLPM